MWTSVNPCLPRLIHDPRRKRHLAAAEGLADTSIAHNSFAEPVDLCRCASLQAFAGGFMGDFWRFWAENTVSTTIY